MRTASQFSVQFPLKAYHREREMPLQLTVITNVWPDSPDSPACEIAIIKVLIQQSKPTTYRCFSFESMTAKETFHFRCLVWFLQTHSASSDVLGATVLKIEIAEPLVL